MKYLLNKEHTVLYKPDLYLQLCLDRLLGLWNGQHQPSLMVKNEVTKPTGKAKQEEEEAELKDHQILKLDLVKGALRTDLILRLR